VATRHLGKGGRIHDWNVPWHRKESREPKGGIKKKIGAYGTRGEGNTIKVTMHGGFVMALVVACARIPQRAR